MKFYNREEELAVLDKLILKSKKQAQMTMVVGRRRIGKTSLLRKASDNQESIYLFVAKKSEPLLCKEFVEIIQTTLGVTAYGEISQFKSVFAWLVELSKERNFMLIIDEFQEFYQINPSVFSDMQNIWDTNKAQSKINLILCGSVYSLMTKIFENAKEPLFARATAKMHIKPFQVSVLKEILADNTPSFTPKNLLAFYALTGGVAKYVETFVLAEAFTLESMLEEIFKTSSLLLEEGKNVLIEEFGKDYSTYFSILSLIASSKTSRPEIESILDVSAGVYLDKLERDFGIIKKIKPILSKPSSRKIKYKIEDNFISFWFRFIYKYRSAVEIENYQLVKEIILRDYPTFVGPILEKYFIEKLKATNSFTEIGSYWSKDNQDEIDIVAINEIEKTVTFAEVKLNKQKISIPILEMKSKFILSQLPNYSPTYLALSLEDL
ncbi:ATP-binding protein [Belliella aquatica]|uniref:ATPase n=1 Tax=Belliella aquatica TaxID=1323734 RepID=A0ABQ1MNL8_9BACT|nr:ATP-binding protein [Belliella aquatica]MCH7405943.1 ATP-binding protein [Belliella aquatica]GGC43944.1 ATPase [Belliella aquatica]